jgi:hypothetical protein
MGRGVGGLYSTSRPTNLGEIRKKLEDTGDRLMTDTGMRGWEVFKHAIKYLEHCEDWRKTIA